MVRSFSAIAKLGIFLGVGIAWSAVIAPAFVAKPPQGGAGLEAGTDAGVGGLRGSQRPDWRKTRSEGTGTPTAQLGLAALGVGLVALGTSAAKVRLASPARHLVPLKDSLKTYDAAAVRMAEEAADRKTLQKTLEEVSESFKRKHENIDKAAAEASMRRPILEESRTPATTKVEQRAGGNLAQYDDTWHIVRDGETAPASATWSNCRIDTSTSEYAETSTANASVPCSGPRAWMSQSLIPLDYRVVEVPRGKLLDPACDALIFGHLPFGSPERQAAEGKAQRRLVVIDETVDDLYGDKVRAYFEARGVVHEIMRLPMVEEEKSMENTLRVCKKMKEFNIDRRTEPVIAIGGGVCLDVVGLASSLFRRRTPYIRVPTTSLAYVDASVGAKNGCNFCESKNRLGTYVPPAAALLDSSFFRTQEKRDIANGVSEMAKMSLMKSKELFHLLKDNAPRLVETRFEPRDASDDVPERVLRLSIETMLEELTPNLWEHSLDRLVDFGHAVGQNLEMKALGTEHELMHGEAVACDMAYMSVLANVLGKITAEERDSILSMLRTCQVPVYSPFFTREFFREAMEDRVQNSMGQRLPLPAGIGKGCVVNDVSDADFEKAFVLYEELCKQ